MASKRSELKGKTRTRTFHYNWCNRTETDEVCLTCQAIVVGTACGYCAQQLERRAANLQKVIDRKAKGELPSQLGQTNLLEGLDY